MRRAGILGAIAAAAAAFFVSGVPVFGADNGTVNATVTSQAVACITITTTDINYGTRPFSSTTLSTSSADIQGVSNCAGSPQTLLAKGTDATGSPGTWTLVDVTGGCGTGLSANQFRHEVSQLAGGAVRLSTADKSLGTLAANDSGLILGTTLTMPCVGSLGPGQMSTQIILTATVP